MITEESINECQCQCQYWSTIFTKLQTTKKRLGIDRPKLDKNYLHNF